MNNSIATIACYAPTMGSLYGLWVGENLFRYTMPLFLIQLLFAFLLTRAIDVILHPLRQPRYISEIIGGIVLGPAAMGRIPGFALTLFPPRSLVVIEAIAYLGLIYYIFTVGVEIDISINIGKREKIRSINFAFACVLPPFAIGAAVAHVVHRRITIGAEELPFLFFVGITLSVTGLSAIARALAGLKLVGSELGHLSLGAAIHADTLAWILICFALTLARPGESLMKALWAVLSAVGLYFVCLVVVRPTVGWLSRRKPEGEELGEMEACGILVGVLAAALAGDATGTHAIYGAFVYGLVVPQGAVGEALVERVEDLVEGILLPLFFIFTGMRARIGSVTDAVAAAALAVAVIGGAAAKVAASVVVGMLHGMPLRDGLSMGMIMNIKGVMEPLVLNIGKDKGVLGDEAFTTLLLMSMLMTALVGPLLPSVVKPARHRLVSYKRRTIRWHNPDSELRLMACIHTTRNVPALVGLLDVFNPTKRSPIFLYALHLVELTGRASAILSASSADVSHSGGRNQAQSDQIAATLEAYEQHAAGVSVQTLTAFSRYATIHEDVLAVADERCTAVVVLPFHKHRAVDGVMDVTNQSIRGLNRSILELARCSVAVLVDRGFGGAATLGHRPSYRVAVLFIGGPDDREVLACAGRMAGHPGATLTVLRLVPSARPPLSPLSPLSLLSNKPKVLSIATGIDRERRADEESISELRVLGGDAIAYGEKESGNAEETMAAIRSMGSGHDLFIVGRGEGQASPMTEGLSEFTECPELGMIGDFLASSDFMATVSVLVVQKGGTLGEAVTLDSPGKHVKLHVHQDRTARGI